MSPVRWLALPARAAPWLAYAAVAAACYALKDHYAEADADALGWILAPTAACVELLTGAHFVREAGVGYVSRELGTAIVPGCAGVNFLIVALATLTVGFAHRPRGPRQWALSASALPALALGATLAVNTVRITADLTLRSAAAAVLDHDSAHRLLGATLYLLSACVLYAIGDTLTRARS